jgi:hypothetical protein
MHLQSHLTKREKSTLRRKKAKKPKEKVIENLIPLQNNVLTLCIFQSFSFHATVFFDIIIIC